MAEFTQDLTTIEAPQTAETALQAPLPATLDTSLMSPRSLNHLVKTAKLFSESNLVPEAYRGNVANCFVACELSARMGQTPLLVMQHLYVVKGKPGWSGQACIALILGCGLFKDFELRMSGEEGTDGRACQAVAFTKSGREVRGTTVGITMAKAEGWWAANPKWRNMPEQMLKYRAASFFAKTECPNVLMGFQLADEVEDVAAIEAGTKVTLTRA